MIIERRVSVLEMHLGFNISTKRPQFLKKEFLFRPYPRARLVPYLVGCDVYSNTRDMLGKVAEKLLVCDPRVRFATVASVQPDHTADSRHEVVQPGIDTRCDRGQLVDNLVEHNTALAKAHQHYREIKRGVLFIRVQVQH